MTTPVTNTPTAISLFAGAGGDTLGLERAGFTVSAFSELNKAAIETHLANFPNSLHLKGAGSKGADITLIPDEVFEKWTGKVSVVFAGFPCFTKNTLILTNHGYKPIQEVLLEDQLLTHTGQFQPIVNLQEKNYNGTLYNIRVKYHPYPIRATKEHPFYVRRREMIWNNSKRKYESNFTEPSWTEAHDLTMDDYFGMSINTKEVTPEFTFQQKVNKSKSIDVKLRLDNLDQWFMLGYFVGDGWVQDTKKADGQRIAHIIRFAIADKDRETVLPRLERVLPITAKYSRTGAAEKYGCANTVWGSLLKEFGKYAHGKRIPEWVHDAPLEFLEEFIAGYAAADGYLKDASQMITTVSPDLAFGLQRIFLKMGQITSIQWCKRPSTCVIDGRTVNQRDTYTVIRSSTSGRYSSFIEGNYAWFAPYSITTQEVTNEKVYNFEVETDNSYCVENIIVHNCQGVSRAGKKKADDPRNQMYLQFVRATRLVRPRFIIGENVTGLATMKSPKGGDGLLLDDIRAAFAAIGYELTWKVLEATDYGVPQKRKRMLLVGWRTDEGLPPLDTSSFWAAVGAWGATQHLPRLRTFVAPSLEGAYPLKEDEVPEGFDAVAQDLGVEAPGAGIVSTGVPHPFVTLKAGQKLLSCSKRASPVHSEVIDLDKPSKTVICTYDHQPRLLVGLCRGAERWVRTLLPDELKRIQGFPADFVLRGNTKERVVQVGNAVPPALVEAVARRLRALLL